MKKPMFVDQLLGVQVRFIGRPDDDRRGKLWYRPYVCCGNNKPYKIPGFTWQDSLDDSVNDFELKEAALRKYCYRFIKMEDEK